MLAKRVNFKSAKDIYFLLTVLKKHKLIELISDNKGNIRVQANANNLSKHFLMGNDGYTYFVPDKEKLAANESKLSVKFYTKKMEVVPIGSLINKSDLLFNKPLAQTLSTIEYNEINPNYIKMEWPQPFLKSTFPMLFPIITKQEKTYDFYDLEDWLGYFRVRQQPRRHLVNVSRQLSLPVSMAECIYNNALQSLIQVNIDLIQKRKIEYLTKLASGKIKNKLPNLNLILGKLRKMSYAYEMSILHKKINAVDVKLKELRDFEKRIDRILVQHPTLADKNLDSLIDLSEELYKFNLLEHGGGPVALMVIGVVLLLASIISSFAYSFVNYPIFLLGGVIFFAGIMTLRELDKKKNYADEMRPVLNELIKYIETYELRKKSILTLENREREINKILEEIEKNKTLLRERVNDISLTAQSQVWEGVLCLIDAGVDVNKKNTRGQVLLSAVAANEWSVVTSLVEHGMSINEENKQAFYLALQMMVDKKSWDEAKYLIEQGALSYAEPQDRKLMKQSLKKANKWGEFSAANRFFKAKANDSVIDNSMQKAVGNDKRGPRSE